MKYLTAEEMLICDRTEINASKTSDDFFHDTLRLLLHESASLQVAADDIQTLLTIISKLRRQLTVSEHERTRLTEESEVWEKQSLVALVEENKTLREKVNQDVGLGAFNEVVEENRALREKCEAWSKALLTYSNRLVVQSWNLNEEQKTYANKYLNYLDDCFRKVRK